MVVVVVIVVVVVVFFCVLATGVGGWAGTDVCGGVTGAQEKGAKSV